MRTVFHSPIGLFFASFAGCTSSEPSDDGNELLDQARDTVERVLAECQAHRTTEVHLVQQELHDALAELVSHVTGKRPMVLPVVVEV